MNSHKKPFFVGYLKPPRQLFVFLIICSVGLIIGFGLASYLTGAAQNDPGDGRYRYDLKRQNLTGFFELLPYPLFHVTQGSAHIPVGHTLMLTRGGKRGLNKTNKALAGKLVTLKGVLIKRGGLDMLQVIGQIKPIDNSIVDIPKITIENLGRWKIAGEICDGECLAGAMRPGRGLAHKACANLCLSGGIPPVFVASEKVLNEEYFLITGPDNTPLPDKSSDYIGQYISLEGDLQRRGSLVVLRMDPESVKKL